MRVDMVHRAHFKLNPWNQLLQLMFRSADPPQQQKYSRFPNKQLSQHIMHIMLVLYVWSLTLRHWQISDSCVLNPLFGAISSKGHDDMHIWIHIMISRTCFFFLNNSRRVLAWYVILCLSINFKNIYPLNCSR